ncbi:galactose mutarotase-like protein [Heliocybe sulcata]|uniref:Galactose mutarotase-like protein n=1 Tax=Heliocybe sulcata TaxID=5364 RepID=A0A5C3NEZ0_9AGAM|nr:galactose mutarotase-like protein [Heliocybe sulcata]
MLVHQAVLLCLPLIASAAVAGRWAPPDPLEVVELAAPDASVKANFIARGATLTNFWVKDKNGNFRDIILGFDNHTNYVTDDLGHPYFGPIVGRYANRIKNGTFSVPVSANITASTPNVYHTPENENNGTDTLHGGTDGFDRRTWTIANKSESSVTFSLLDPDGMQGFPGNVYTEVVYTLEPNSTWKISIHAAADQETPIMLSGHHYWNLEAYEETQDLSGHYAQFNASRIIAGNAQLIPDGTLLNVSGTPADFRQAKSLGEAINATVAGEYCGAGCVGFDNCWVYDNNTGTTPIFSLWSVNSGIRMDVITDQPALQVYTCDGIYNASLPIPRKEAQGGNSTFYENHSCLVIEQESWIDAINYPDFGIDQIYGPGRDYHWQSSYIFSTL